MSTFLRSASVLAVLAAALAASSQTVFYGGDFDGFDSVSSERNGVAFPTASTIYDDFALTSVTSVAGFFGEFDVTQGGVLGLGYEVRQGVSAGNGGTLLASGTLTGVTTTQVGTVSGDPIDRISGSVSVLTLGPGTYYLGLYALMNGSSDAFLVTTSGANAVGSPIDDGNAYVNYGNLDYKSTTSAYGASYHDFSIGVVANPTPEPSALAALGLGAVAVLRRRKRA